MYLAFAVAHPERAVQIDEVGHEDVGRVEIDVEIGVKAAVVRPLAQVDSVNDIACLDEESACFASGKDGLTEHRRPQSGHDSRRCLERSPRCQCRPIRRDAALDI